MRNLPDAGDGASAVITDHPSRRRAPRANVPGNDHMNGLQTAKAATASTVGDPLKFKQDQINPTITSPPAKRQRQPENKNVIATLRKGRRNSVVASVSESIGRPPILDIRQHRPDGLRVLQPTKLAISDIDAELARELISVLLLFLARCEP